MYRAVEILDVTITAAVANQVSEVLSQMGAVKSLVALAVFDYGSGGTDITLHIQTSLDGGITWIDIACFHFLVADLRSMCNLTNATAVAVVNPTDGTLADDTVRDGILGDRFRAKYTSTGTYADSTTLKVYLQPKV